MLKALLFFSVFVTEPRHIKVPTVRYHSGARFRIENPLKRPVTVVMNCGEDWELIPVRVDAESERDFIIKDPNLGDIYSCFMDSWERARK